VRPKDDRTLEYALEGATVPDLATAAHLTLIPHLDKPLETAAGQKLTLGEAAVALSANQLGEWIAHAGYRLRVPPTASLRWPVFPHNPYRADGHATLQEARLVVDIPFDAEHREQKVTLEIP
jgi:hypothetical protein